MKTSEALRNARNLLENQKWGQGSTRLLRGQMCAADAISLSVRHDARLACKCVVAMEKVIEFPYLVEWNDKAGRTKDEVLTAFDHAIKLAKEDEDASPEGS